MNINRDNYETFFLLYVDNELSAPERNALELFIQDNADLQEELEMLQQSTIEPEPIIFKGKSSLFKTEKLERYMHALGGFTLFVSGAGILFMGW